jgi:cobalt-zinc-cadmium efflux system protein
MIYRIYWIDPILTILISLYIVKVSYEILKEATEVVMMSVPPTINVEEVAQFITKTFPEISNIHHVHIWRMNDNDIHFEAHLDIRDMLITETTALKIRLEKELRNTFELNHFTFQFECGGCVNTSLIHN